MTIYAFIFLHNGVITEDALWRHMADIGLDRKLRNHMSFGSIEQYVSQTLVKQQYLDRKKVDPNSVEVDMADSANSNISQSQSVDQLLQYQYRMGPRGLCETTVQQVYRFVCSLLNEAVDSVFLNDLNRKQAVSN